MIKKRIITGCILILFSFLFYLTFSPLSKFIIFIALTIKASKEMLIIINKEEDNTNSPKFFGKQNVIIIFTVLFFIISFLFLDIKYNKCIKHSDLSIINYFDKNSFFVLLSPFIILLFSFVFLPSWNTLDLAKTFLIIFYVGGGMGCLFTLILSPLPHLLFFVLIVVLTDSFAFLARFECFFSFLNIGLLAPRISPKKTKKGAVLGTCGAVLGTSLVFWIFPIPDPPFDGNFLFIAYIFLISIISQISDLLASKFKRDFNIKDFGHFLPGHGGFLDRFDSWLFTSFFALLILNF